MPSASKHCFAWRAEGGFFGDTGEPFAAAIYGIPVNRHWPKDSVELQRLVRRDDVDIQLSQFVAWSLRWLKLNADYSFALSYADTGQGHHGGIYQATNWVFVGSRDSAHIGFNTPGGFIHGRSCNSRFGTRSIDKIAIIKPDWVPVYGRPKHLYIYPLKQRLNKILQRMGWESLPYPKPEQLKLESSE